MVLFNEFSYKSFLEINEAIILFYFGFHEDKIKKDTKGMDVHHLLSVKVSSLERVIPSPTQAQTSYNCHPQIPSKSLLTNSFSIHPSFPYFKLYFHPYLFPPISQQSHSSFPE